MPPNTDKPVKKYRLLRDLPDSLVGDIYIWNESQKAYYKNGNVLDSYWQREEVENLSEWFEPVPEHQPKRIEVEVFGGRMKGADLTIRLHSHEDIFPEYKFPAIKEAIERVLNDTGISYWAESYRDDNKDKILDIDTGNIVPDKVFINKKSYIPKSDSKGWEILREYNVYDHKRQGVYKPHSVKRLRDLEVFTVGGKWMDAQEISGFELSPDDKEMFIITKGGRKYPLDAVYPLQK